MSKKVLFYSSVKDKNLFNTQFFYKTDINLLKSLGYNVITSNKISDFLFFWKYDIAFIYFYKYGLFVAIIARLFLKKVFFTGGIDNLEKEFATPKRFLLQVLFFRLCYLFSNKCIVVSNSDKNNILKIYKRKKLKKLEYSFHSIDVDKYFNKIETLQQNNFVTIAWMGKKSNVIRKGIDRSIRLFKNITEKYDIFKNSNLIIVGVKGEGSHYLEELVEKLDISDKVLFTGEIEENEKISLLKKSKYYFQLSSYEGFGIAALEALAAGNIVIHSGKGGLADSVSKYGVLININDEISKQAEDVFEQINSFKYNKLEEAKIYISHNFSMEKRLKDFRLIIDS